MLKLNTIGLEIQGANFHLKKIGEENVADLNVHGHRDPSLYRKILLPVCGSFFKFKLTFSATTMFFKYPGGGTEGTGGKAPNLPSIWRALVKNQSFIKIMLFFNPDRLTYILYFSTT
jgi:hypothetical protein